MAKITKVKKVNDPEDFYAGAFGSDMTSLLDTFRVAIETASKLYNEGFRTLFDLGNLVDDVGFPLEASKDEATARFFACGSNAGQWNILRIMLMKFAWLYRPGHEFDHDKEGDIFSKELSTLAVIEAAWSQRDGKSDEAQPASSGAAAKKTKVTKKNVKEKRLQ
jgi:hypothetical protein